MQTTENIILMGYRQLKDTVILDVERGSEYIELSISKDKFREIENESYQQILDEEGDEGGYPQTPLLWKLEDRCRKNSNLDLHELYTEARLEEDLTEYAKTLID